MPRPSTYTPELAKKDNWRKKIVEFVAKHFLDVFDPSGKHI